MLHIGRIRVHDQLEDLLLADVAQHLPVCVWRSLTDVDLLLLLLAADRRTAGVRVGLAGGGFHEVLLLEEACGHRESDRTSDMDEHILNSTPGNDINPRWDKISANGYQDRNRSGIN